MKTITERLTIADIKLVVHIEGGVVQSISSNCKIPISVCVRDEDVYELNDGDEFGVRKEETSYHPDFVAETFSGVDEDIPVLYKDQEKYLEEDGGVCPNCGSVKIESRGHLDVDGTMAIGEVVCNDCDATWDDVFQLTHFNNLEPI